MLRPTVCWAASAATNTSGGCLRTELSATAVNAMQQSWRPGAADSGECVPPVRRAVRASATAAASGSNEWLPARRISASVVVKVYHAVVTVIAAVVAGQLLALTPQAVITWPMSRDSHQAQWYRREVARKPVILGQRHHRRSKQEP